VFIVLSGFSLALSLARHDTRPIRKLGLCSYSLYLTHAPIVVVVYEKIAAGRVAQGVPAFLVMLALALPLTITFARVFASVFEIPFLTQRARPESARSPEPRAGRVPA
jgi:peptidoglycan/LPS O-acetylase OafA/YrhL